GNLLTIRNSFEHTGSAGFSLWVLVLAGTNPHRLKPALPNPQHQRLAAATRATRSFDSIGRTRFRFPAWIAPARISIPAARRGAGREKFPAASTAKTRPSHTAGNSCHPGGKDKLRNSASAVARL